MTALTDSLPRLRSSASSVVTRVLGGVAPSRNVPARVKLWWRIPTSLARTVTAVMVLSWVCGWILGWQELMVVAGGCLVLLVLAALFVFIPAAVRVDVMITPTRVVAGDPSAGEVTATNGSSNRSLPVQIQLRVGAGLAFFDVPSLARGAHINELFVVPSERRGVIPVGPATSVRSDPIGLFRREAASSAAYELIVHPRTVPLDPFGSGLLRDLEGLTTKDLSVSDLAFHALREYTPGDDRRHVHWRSSAKTGQLMIRQFQDTRRSSLCVVVDGAESSYADSSEFETALEVAGSLVKRACRDELPTTLIAADQTASGTLPHVLLDALARAECETEPVDMGRRISWAIARRPDVSFGVVVSGSLRAVEGLQRTIARFPAEVRCVALRVVPQEPPGVRASGRVSIIQLQALTNLPALLKTELVT